MKKLRVSAWWAARVRTNLSDKRRSVHGSARGPAATAHRQCLAGSAETAQRRRFDASSPTAVGRRLVGSSPDQLPEAGWSGGPPSSLGLVPLGPCSRSVSHTPRNRASARVHLEYLSCDICSLLCSPCLSKSQSRVVLKVFFAFSIA